MTQSFSDRDIQFRDGLGLRVRVADAAGDAVEHLRVSTELAQQESAIRERVGRLINFRHARYVRLRGVDRLKSGTRELIVSSDAVDGHRLSTVLETIPKLPLALDVDVALQIVRDLLPAVGILHDSRKVTHGAIAPERLVFTTQQRLVIVDYGFGLALGRLNLQRRKLWEQYRIAVPSSGRAVFDERTDVVQIGMVALALLLGRPLQDDEYPAQLKRLILSIKEHSSRTGTRPIGPELRRWLERALAVDEEKTFATVREAQEAFEAVLTGDRYAPSAAQVKAFFQRYQELLPRVQPAAASGRDETSGSEVDKALEQLSVTVTSRPAARLSQQEATSAPDTPKAADAARKATATKQGAASSPSAASASGKGAGSRDALQALEEELARLTSPDVTRGARNRQASADAGTRSASKAAPEPLAVSALEEAREDAYQQAEVALSAREAGARTVSASARQAREEAERAEREAREREEAERLAREAAEQQAREAALREAAEREARAAAERQAREAAERAAKEAAERAAAERAAREAAAREAREREARERAEREMRAAAERAAREQAEREAAEAAARARAEEEARERARREAAEREAAERIAREAEAREAAEREAREQAEVEARRAQERAAREAAEREAAERAAHDAAQRALREAAERAAAEQAAREAAERAAREAAERTAAEKAAREAAQRAAREAAEREAAERAAREAAERAAREAAERKAAEEAAREAAARVEAERQARAEAERLAREAAERAAREAAERAAAEEAARAAAARIEAERQARAEAERAAREAAERAAREIAAMREAAEAAARAAAARAEAEREARAAAERRAKEAEERAAREQAERETAERAAREANDQAAREAAEAAVRSEGKAGTGRSRRRKRARRRQADALVAQASMLASSPEVPPGTHDGDEAVEFATAAALAEAAAGPASAATDPSAFYEWSPTLAVDAIPAWARGTIAEGTETSTAPTPESADVVSIVAPPVLGAGTGLERYQLPANAAAPSLAPLAESPLDDAGSKAEDTGAEVSGAGVVVPYRPRRRFEINWARTIAASLLVAMIEGVAFAAAWWFVTPTERGWLIVHTKPSGIDVSIDGRTRGRTPLVAELRPGRHTIELRHGTATRVVPVEISPGVQTEQRILFGNGFRTGQARITSTAEGARVLIDGRLRGRTPLTVSELSAGRHEVTVEAESGTVTAPLIIEPGETTELDVPVYSGWVTVLSQVPLEILLDGRLLGTTDAEKLMLAPGRHRLEFRNDSLGYRGTEEVQVRPGATTSIAVVPKVRVTVEGPEGAELWVDGERAGTLPLKEQLSVPIGTREFLLTGNDGHERRQIVVVTMTTPVVVRY